MGKGVLLLSIAYPPNIGGVETHLDDLTKALTKRNWPVFVLTYKPITTKVSAPFFEEYFGARIYRIPWISDIFYNLVNKPVLEFLYLAPGLFFGLLIFLIFNSSKLKVIHAHGLVAGFAAVILGKLFSKRVVVSTHSLYQFPQSGLYRAFAQLIFSLSDFVSTLSKQSQQEIISLGINPEKVGNFTYWIDLNNFKKNENAKKDLGWNGFNVLFVGRLIPEKGLRELVSAVKFWNKEISLQVIGTGSLEDEIKKEPKIHFLGAIDNNKLPMYYSAADILIMPSTHEEGFGRVILESLACGTPVIGSNRGAIPEAMDESVGKLIDVTEKNLKDAVEYFFNNPKELEKMQKKTRSFAAKRFSEKNVEVIIKSYERKNS